VNPGRSADRLEPAFPEQGGEGVEEHRVGAPPAAWTRRGRAPRSRKRGPRAPGPSPWPAPRRPRPFRS
jgi:hypothetical protein